ncbi:putative molybdopterin biosynthesis protein [Paenibacillus cellulosilyticus]|uniref:Putative molybdopterin biosynthesis protein n=1 Tax=Paenibacillus cellulosilyticus TaxID=375489 RepID=A0A2V2YZ95_9BACL|nr:helix-turn-helix transcriptional regulator [Paenibacillus cellulosilyticus]PWV98654.1 putative molybdopterin biosynthesis protein [Paenibacillus cellulosilyticus]QKS43834.1 helix-turn-helix transcriptional regulator [Paenibacillus cellulosilyticus]
MSQDMSYTAEEIARLLKISKLTVYDLIKKGDLPSYRVGKQMRVDATDLEAYKQRSKNISATAAVASSSPQQLPDRLPSYITTAPASELPGIGAALPAPAAQGVRPIVITGQDISLDILAKHLESQSTGLRPLRSYAGSLDSLISMYKGESDIVSTHLLDGDTGEYNIPYIRRLLVGLPYKVINLLSRPAGLYVAKGNPLGIQSWSDLSRPGLRLANREQGAGARVLLDEQLRLNSIKPAQLNGYYDQIHGSHLSVAAKVAAGEADIGVGAEKATNIVGQVDFIPLIMERYDLVVLNTAANQPMIDALLSILHAEPFKQELRAIAGYDLSLTGQVLYEN